MNLYKSTTILCVVVLLLAGCAGSTEKNTARVLNETAEESGSPYRWSYQGSEGEGELVQTLIGARSQTMADEKTMTDVMRRVVKLEDHGIADLDARPREVRVVSRTETSSSEVWVFDGPVNDIVYMVNLQRTASGRMDISVTGPW